jgi:hypothetical protein
MRKIALPALLVFLSFSLSAQDYEEFTPKENKPFRVDVFGGLAMPAGNLLGGGVLLGIEPKYAITPAINTGLRLEGVGLVRSFYRLTLNQQKIQADLTLMGSALVTGDYYFHNTSNIRYFAGLGAGAYWYGAASFEGNTNTDIDPAETKAGVRVGMMPRIGIEGYHMRVAAEYNFVGKAGRTRNSYLGLKLGIYLGGGKIKESPGPDR